jgi:hypothetical protein
VAAKKLEADALVQPIGGWIANRIGRKRFYWTCAALSTVTSLLCGLAPTVGVLVLCCVLHGTADGGLQPSEQTVLVDTLSRQKRSMAFGVYNSAWAPEQESDELGSQSELIKKIKRQPAPGRDQRSNLPCPRFRPTTAPAPA